MSRSKEILSKAENKKDPFPNRKPSKQHKIVPYDPKYKLKGKWRTARRGVEGDYKGRIFLVDGSGKSWSYQDVTDGPDKGPEMDGYESKEHAQQAAEKSVMMEQKASIEASDLKELAGAGKSFDNSIKDFIAEYPEHAKYKKILDNAWKEFMMKVTK